MVFTRGRTSQKRLEIAWRVPVYQGSAFAHTGTSNVLSREKAFAFIRGTDPRPLLVLRECHMCSGTDFALLRRATNNERTMLLTRWFRCVKLPSSVLDKDHALRELFPRKQPPHLFFATNDAKQIITLPGNQTPSAVWKCMTKILRESYEGSPSKAVKQLLVTLDKFDTLDSKQMQVRRRLDRTLETAGPKSRKFKELKAQFDALEKQRKALLAREKKLSDLGLKKTGG
jgi:hypothetical protein